MAKHENVYKLGNEVSQAIAAGMSYGKWKAIQPVVAPPPKNPPEGFKVQVCAFCGCEFINSNNRAMKYCGDVCRIGANDERRRKKGGGA